jgi:LAS superfamily LD-carboxypeptidase LdcB
MKKLICTLLCLISLSSNAGFVVCELNKTLGIENLECTNKSIENLMNRKFRNATRERMEIQRNANVENPTTINKRLFLIKELLSYGFEIKTDTIFTLNI